MEYGKEAVEITKTALAVYRADLMNSLEIARTNKDNGISVSDVTHKIEVINGLLNTL